MQKAKKDFAQITIEGQKYLFSLVEKENDSGLMFNDRILFLIPDKYIGYVSDTKASQPQYIPFQKAKQTVSIQNIKTVLVNERQFKIKYNAVQNSKKIEKIWLFRAQDTTLSKKWQDKLQYQKGKQMVRKQLQQAPKLIQTQPQIKKSMIVRNSPVNRQRKTLSFSRAIQLSEHPKKQPQPVLVSTLVGTDPVQKQPEPQLPHFKQTQRKEMGTIVSQKSNSSIALQQKVAQKPVSRRDANFGTSLIQENVRQEENEGKEAIDKKQEYTDRSMLMDNAQVLKSMRSQPVGNKAQPSFYSNNIATKQHQTVQIQDQQPQREKTGASNPSVKQKDPSEPKHTEVKQKTQKSNPNTNKIQPQTVYKIQNSKPQQSRQSQMKQMGTSYSQINQYQSSIQKKQSEKPVSRRDANFGTSLIQENVRQEENEGKEAIDKKQEYTDRSMLMDNAQVLKSMRSQPVGNKAQPSFYSNNIATKQHQTVQIQDQQPHREKSGANNPSVKQKDPSEPKHTEAKQKTQKSNPNTNKIQTQKIEKSKFNQINKFQKEPSLINYQKDSQNKSFSRSELKQMSIAFSEAKQPSTIKKKNEQSYQKSSFHLNYVSGEAELSEKIEKAEANQKMLLSNVKYISPQQYQQMNLSQSYYDRASKLIKQSSVQKSKWKDSDDNTQEIKQAKQTPRKSPSSDMKGNVLIKTLEDKKNLNDAQDSKNKNNPNSLNPVKSFRRSARTQIKEEAESIADDLQEIPWTFKYVKYNQLMFQEYVDFTYDLMHQILKDLTKPKSMQTYLLSYVKNNIRYYQIKDIQVKIASIELTSKQMGVVGSEKVCNKDSIRIIRNQYKNFVALYEYLQNNSKLRVPLICLHEMNGFLGSFKLKGRGAEQQVKMRQIQEELGKLKIKSKIDHNFFQHHSKYLVKLDQQYYDKFKDPNNQFEHEIKFDCIFIQELDGYLLRDLVTDYETPQLAILRKQLISNYVNQGQKEKQLLLSRKSSQRIIENLSENVLKKISEVILQINSIHVYFFNSSQLSNYLHQKGINVRYLGYIYDYLQIGFQKDFFMTEMAARCCKALFRKTLQDLTLQEGIKHSDLLIKVYDFLNCVLGNTKETSSIWKVISSHCKTYFGVDLCFNEINPSQFVICLVQNCRLQAIWEKINPDQAFKLNQFFSESNLIGVKGCHKIYPPLYNDMYKFCVETIRNDYSQENFEKLMECLSINKDKIPKILKTIQQKLKHYLAIFVTPEQDSKQLNLYPNGVQCPSKLHFGLRLLRIKWNLKNNEKDKYIGQCDDFLSLATKFYGEFHPVFSDLYDTFSNHHTTQENHEDAITFAKSSLVNVLKICGTGHEKTAEGYFKLAVCYIKAKKSDQAASNFKKAKKIVEDKNKADSFFYAVILLKIALISLKQNKLQESLKNANKSLSILQKIDIVESQNELVECYETIDRCYELKNNSTQLRQLSRQIQSKLNLVKTRGNLQKVLKIYLYPILIDLNSQNASDYLDIISQLRPPANQQNYEKSYILLKTRISEGNFRDCLQQYMHKINSIQSYIRDQNLLKMWQSFNQQYQRSTINDFINLTEELICFLGQGFIGGALREAL